jgi:hypothetical protein
MDTPLHKVNTSAIRGEVIWYRRNGEPGKLEEAFKIAGHTSTSAQNVFSGGRVFEQ